ncbi:GntR family transcriptional regulator [Parasphingopyxis sp. CP4]|uniref:GntR family transcriptional regulator n=1 Tax=Parasphingopyxis sp. CP4 TaxID=2724527 RepID=UPI0015A04346|nr:GntR family transcriptional regulator [Parasphingopyxis sp. CP4]QLC22469.1 GntR family transcriptional regulator [Parasphingopyxis sp. CP4]
MSTAADKAYSGIRALILDGTLAAGEQLKEEELADRIGVSRTPIRDALRRLEAEFFVTRSDSQRSFVADQSVEDIDEIFTLRAMLEGHVAARAATVGGPGLAAKLRKIVDSAGDPSDVDAFLDHNADFHAEVLAGAGSERLATMLARLVSQPIVHRTARNYDAGQFERSLAEHRELVDAIDRGDAEWARSVMTSHIRRAFHVFEAATQSLSREK